MPDEPPLINPPAALAFDFPLHAAPAVRPPYAVPASEYAPELAATIADRRAFHDHMIAKGSMTQAEAAVDLAPLEDLLADLGHPRGGPRAGARFAWADKAAELRRILAHRRKKWPDPTGVNGPGDMVARIEALEGLHWTMVVELAWCDAFEPIANAGQRRATLRAWLWAIDQREQRAADAGEPWARPALSTAGRAAWRAANPDLAASADTLDRIWHNAALALGIALKAAA